MKRIFIALKVEPEKTFLSLISSFKVGLRNESIKWTNINNIHITLAFLGDTEESIIKQINVMLKESCSGFEPFELQMRGTGAFRNSSDPRIIWTGIEHSEILTKLNNKIIVGLKEMGIILENRHFNPHLTLGRIKHLNDKNSFKSLLEKFQNIEIQTIPVNEVIVYESVLLPAGPVYTPLAKIGL